MLVKNGVVEKMFIEPDEPGDPFKVSDADTMLDYIDPTAKKPDQVVVFSKEGCPFCAKAKQLLADKGYEYIDLPLEHKVRGKVLGAVSGTMTAPQVFINGKLIGGAEQVEQFLAAA
jgi:glutaredoxin-like protein